MSEKPQFDHDASMFEREFVIKFHLFREARFLLEPLSPDEPFVTTLERTGKRVIDIMKRHNLADLAGKDEDLISNVKYFAEDGWDSWMYSVRMQKRE